MSRAYLILKSFHSHDRSLMMKAYCIYVRPLVEYCSAVWSPHTHCLFDKIEKVQRFFTRNIAGLKNLSYEERLKILRLQSLERRRLFIDLVLCYKILNGKIDCELSNIFTINTNTRSRGHPLYKLYKRQCSCDITKFYFTNRVVNLWGNLPDYVVMATSVSTFKKATSKD
jgi:hypothetical protein